MFTAALFTIAKIWNQPKCPPIEWIRKMWYVRTYTHTHTHTQEYYICIHKKDESVTFVTRWMDLEGIVLSERRLRKTKYQKMALRIQDKSKQVHRKQSQTCKCRQQMGRGVGKVGEGEWEVQASGYRVTKSWGRNAQPTAQCQRLRWPTAAALVDSTA